MMSLSTWRSSFLDFDTLLTQVFAQHPATLLEAKVLAETVELTQSMVQVHQSGKKTINAS